MVIRRRKRCPFGVGIARKEYIIDVEKWGAAEVWRRMGCELEERRTKDGQ